MTAIPLTRCLLLFSYLFISLDVQGRYVEITNPFPENHFVTISVEQGLSQSTVFSILKDSQGFMWFGTRTGGLNRYNGYDFLVFQNDPLDTASLASNAVISLFEDHMGKIWIGTRNGGINVYDHEQEVINRIPIPGHDFKPVSTRAIFQNNPENIWIGTSEGLFSYDFITDSMQLVLSADITGSIGSLSALNNQKLIISSLQKLLIYDSQTHQLNIYNYDFALVSLASDDKIVPAMVDQKDNIWVASVEGVITFTLDANGNLNKNRPFTSTPTELTSDIRTIAADRTGNIWFGTFMGLVKYDPAAGSFTIFNTDEPNPHSLSHKSIYAILVDETNTLWLGTWGGGVNVKSGLFRKFEHFSHQFYNPASLSDNMVSSFAEDNYGVWVATEQGGLNFFDPKSNTFRYYPINNIGPNPAASDHIKALIMDDENNLWVGTFENGVLKLDRNTNTLSHFLGDKRIYSMAQTPDRHIWIGSHALYKLTPEGEIIEQYTNRADDLSSLSGDMVTSLLVDGKGDLWVGTNEGINLYNAHGNNFKRYTHIPGDNQSLSGDYILSLCDGDEQTLWVGTLRGLDKFNKLNGSVRRINEKVSFLDNVINGILKDENRHLWLSTNKGIIQYMPNEETFTHYDFRDGLQSNEFNRGSYYRTRNGKLYFGGINGFNSFYPSQIEKNPHIPQIQFTDLKLFYKSVRPNAPLSPLSRSISRTNEIVLTHAQSAFTLEFVALNYILPEKNQYAYFLEGYDIDWNYVGNTRSANYMNLSPGRYTFHVKASNNDNLWNEIGIRLNIVILPPFWKTRWAIAILGVVLLLLLLLVRAIVVSRIKQQNQIEFQQREVKRIEELNNMKLRFFTDISHEFKTPLTLIVSPIEKLRKFAHLGSEFGYLTNIAYKNTKRMLRLVEQLMTFRRIEKDSIKVNVAEYDMEQILREIIDDFSEMAANKQIRLKLNCQNINSKSQWFDKYFFDKIIFNLVSNAFKYTPKGGDIHVFLTLENNYAHISVKDTGVGIAADKFQKIFDRFYTTDKHEMIGTSGTGIGLSLTKSLVELHHGEITVESNPEKGSTFKVTLPVDRRSYTRDEISPKVPVIEASDDLLKMIDLLEKDETDPADPPPKDKIILIVEDNEDLRNYLVFNFREYNTMSAENGKEALEITSNMIPDLIISDVMMPVMHGFDFLRQIRDNHITSHIPFILLSAKTEISDKIEGLESGADIYIEKPFDLEFLKASVKNLLERRKNLKELYSNNMLPGQDDTEIPASHKTFLEKAAKIILENIDNENFSINELGEAMFLSRSQLFRKFKTICDLAPGEFIRDERLRYALMLLQEGELNVNEVAFQSGFSSASYFITSFKKKFGKTPSEVIKQY